MLENIEAERARLGLSKTAISTQLGITITTYGKYVNEAWSIPSSTLVRMAQLFNCRTDYLLGLDPPTPRNPAA